MAISQTHNFNRDNRDSRILPQVVQNPNPNQIMAISQKLGNIILLVDIPKAAIQAASSNIITE